MKSERLGLLVRQIRHGATVTKVGHLGPMCSALIGAICSSE
jgi:hypothetical protein